MQCQSLKPVLSQCSQTGFVTVNDFIALFACSYVFYSHGCNVFIHARTFFTLADRSPVNRGFPVLYSILNWFFMVLLRITCCFLFIFYSLDWFSISSSIDCKTLLKILIQNSEWDIFWWEITRLLVWQLTKSFPYRILHLMLTSEQWMHWRPM